MGFKGVYIARTCFPDDGSLVKSNVCLPVGLIISVEGVLTKSFDILF